MMDRAGLCRVSRRLFSSFTINPVRVVREGGSYLRLKLHHRAAVGSASTSIEFATTSSFPSQLGYSVAGK
jgi:hypothetical protein